MRKGRHRATGFTTIEVVISIALFGFVLVSLVGLHLVAISAGAAAETSSIAANLARARMEELLARPVGELSVQNDAQTQIQVPSATGRIYRVSTSVVSPGPARLDLTVTVTWQVVFGTDCANCIGSRATYSRTLHTRVQIPDQTHPSP